MTTLDDTDFRDTINGVRHLFEDLLEIRSRGTVEQTLFSHYDV
jgi:hypothetical protein